MSAQRVGNNVGAGNMAGASEPDPVLTKQQRIAELAQQDPQRSLFALAHHIDLRWLYEAYRRVRADGATGVDGQTAQDYAAQLGNNLRSLLERAQSGTYRAPPVRREHIPKGMGTETRPIAIPTFEDKVLQRAVVWAGRAEPVEEVEQIVGILSGGIEADDEGDGAVALVDAIEALAEAGIADGRLRELEFVGSWLEVVAEEGGVVAVTRRVDADANAAGQLRSGRVVC